MRITTKLVVPAVTALCVAFAAAPALSQTTSATTSNPSAQGQTNGSGDQYDTLFESLAGLLVQPSSNFSPDVGGKVPNNVQLQPMPKAAAQAMPEAQGHHVAKVDDNTTVIADPETRQILGIISSAFGGGSGNGTTTPNASGTTTTNN